VTSCDGDTWAGKGAVSFPLWEVWFLLSTPAVLAYQYQGTSTVALIAAPRGERARSAKPLGVPSAQRSVGCCGLGSTESRSYPVVASVPSQSAWASSTGDNTGRTIRMARRPQFPPSLAQSSAETVGGGGHVLYVARSSMICQTASPP